MKKIAIWNNYTTFAQNKAFDPTAYGIGEDLGWPVIHLKDELERKGYVVETLDMDKTENYEKIVFLDYPNPETCCYNVHSIPKEKKYLVLTECEIIYKENNMPSLYNDFNKVFAYNDNLVKEHGYIKLNLPNKLKTPLFVPFSQKKICTMIAGNKKSRETGELYSARYEAIKYFEKKHRSDFDLYGMGWNTFRFTGPKLIRGLNRVPGLTKLFAQKHPCYKGKVDKKLQVLSQYKFAICYENSCIIPGYISEKIWDCFFSGCVPVYWGAPNVSDYIPKNCYIDKRNFSTYEDLYNYIKNMTESDYNAYLKAAKDFIASDKAYPFSGECFADTLIREMDL